MPDSYMPQALLIKGNQLEKLKCSDNPNYDYTAFNYLQYQKPILCPELINRGILQ